MWVQKASSWPFLSTRQIGPGGFDSSDFEIVQQLGSIAMQQVRGHQPVTDSSNLFIDNNDPPLAPF